jgi:putative membrane protein
MRSEPRALHPATVLLGMPLGLIVRAIVLPGAALFASGLADVLALIALLVAFAVSRVLAWRRFRFSFDGEVMRVDSGVLQRTHRSVDVARVQQVEIDRPLAQRLLGVATLRIETAGADDEPEVELRVLAEADAVALRGEVLAGRDRARGGVTAEDAMRPGEGPGTGSARESARESGELPGAVPDVEPVMALSTARVALAAVTGAQLLVAPALLIGALQLTELRLDELVLDVAAQVGTLSSTLGVTAVVGVGALVAVAVVLTTTLVAGIVRDGGFRIERAGEDLVVRRGLLGTRESIVPLRRVQVVRVVANPLRRALGMATVRIHSAGGSGGASGGGERRRVVVPLVTEAEVAPLLAALLPSLGELPDLAPHPRAAVRRSVVRHVLPLLELGAAAVLLVRWLGEVRTAELLARADAALPATLPLASLVGGLTLTIALTSALLGVTEGRSLAHGISGRLLVAQHGAVTRTRGFVPLARVQAVTHSANWFQRRLGLASVVAHVAGPGGDVRVLDAAEDRARLLRVGLATAATGAPAGRASDDAVAVSSPRGP